MKNLAFTSTCAAMLFALNTAIAQSTGTSIGTYQIQVHDTASVAKENEGFDRNNLPGEYYDIGIPPGYETPKFPKDPKFDAPETMHGDISVQIKRDGPVIQEQCSDYFTVNYKVIAKSNHADMPVTFPVTVEDNSAAVTGQSGINSFPDQLITLNAGDSLIMIGSLHIRYPYTLGTTKGNTGKQYVSKQFDITAKCSGGSHSQFNVHYNLVEANKQNNEDVLHITTPLPFNCVRMNEPEN